MPVPAAAIVFISGTSSGFKLYRHTPWLRDASRNLFGMHDHLTDIIFAGRQLAKKWLISGMFLTAFAAHPAAFADANIVIICNKDVAVDALRRDDVRDIFLGKQRRWPDDNMAEIVTLANYDIHRRFLQQFTAKTPTQFRTYWRKMLFTGKGMVPKAFPDEKSLITYIAKTKGAIGYMTAPVPPDNRLKIIRIIGEEKNTQ